jgi:outer membrane protein assembly factor BamB
MFGEVENVPPIAHEGFAIVRADSGRSMAETYAFEIEKGEFRWRADHPGGTASRIGHGAILPAGDDAIVEVWEGRPGVVIARDLADGSERWRVTLPPSEGAWTADVHGETVTVRSAGIVVRLSVADGSAAQAPN